ncbi:MAG: LysR family transcriptional regulator [Clostridia bacterium]|nr:LysR family transcriptional regulator [Clostridia bacterium]
MNVSKYKALLAAVDMGSFSAAANSLGYTQSGMTHMMNSLEEEIGFPILQRGYFGVKLTASGEKIIPRIRELVNCEDALFNEIEILKSYGDNIIRIGAYSSLATHWLPSIVEEFGKQFPEVTVNIQTGTVEELYSGLESGRFDMVFGTKLAKYGFKWIPLALDKFYAVLPKGYPLDNSDEFRLSGFNGTKFLMPGLGFDDDISAVFQENSIKPFVTQTYVDDPAIISMVEHGQGISMLSELIISDRKDSAMFVPIAPAVYRKLAVALREDYTPTAVAKKLLSITKDYVRTVAVDNTVPSD